MSTHQLWRIDDASPGFDTRASTVGGPTTEGAARQRARRHNERSLWNGYPSRWIVLPVGECPPEATERLPLAAGIRDEAGR